MLYNRCTGICKFGNNTYPRCIRCRSNLDHIFQEKKCVLWAGKYCTWLWCCMQDDYSNLEMSLNMEHLTYCTHSNDCATAVMLHMKQIPWYWYSAAISMRYSLIPCSVTSIICWISFCFSLATTIRLLYRSASFSWAYWIRRGVIWISLAMSKAERMNLRKHSLWT